ncbi:DNA-deoxyinosine glycosylase [uncultured Nevskia sp.]|uniref:DNA-deoxyinosine glycosylase n=1 Tax=uncultured Nevskia sp. TaxID=228950 RepID=UPI0025D74A5A|nr:DNA-deoxyinosine glycosylase [uncultured Nevskia sp.]
MDLVESFAPLEPPSARLLILGSMPGIASLRAQQYYGHPRNQFWPMMEALFGVRANAAYAERIAGLLAQGIALWDVLRACERPGSLDSSIVRGSEQANDFAGFLDRHPQLKTIALNGGTARDAFHRHVLPTLGERLSAIRLIALPSTSPANASINAAAKRAAWAALLPQA